MSCGFDPVEGPEQPRPGNARKDDLNYLSDQSPSDSVFMVASIVRPKPSPIRLHENIFKVGNANIIEGDLNARIEDIRRNL